jgi:hypothetical protein
MTGLLRFVPCVLVEADMTGPEVDGRSPPLSLHIEDRFVHVDGDMVLLLIGVRQD